VANISGEINENQNKYLSVLKEKYKIDIATLKLVQQLITSKQIYSRQYTILPITINLKLEYLLEHILLMIHNEKIDERGLEICKDIAYKYGFEREIVDMMLNQVIDDILDIEEFEKKYSNINSRIRYFQSIFKDQIKDHEVKTESRNRSIFNLLY
jgi:hypothetical protein